MPDASNADDDNANAEINSPSSDWTPDFVHEFFSEKNAKYLYEETVLIKALFGAFDGLIISYSTFKCYFDLACPPGTSSSDAMHEWMASPLAFIGSMLEAAFIMTLSYIGNIYDEDNKKKILASLAWFWPYFRDGFKGLKFSYKGVRSIIQLVQMIGVDLQSVFVPVGLVIGVAAATNRIWYRNQVTDPRKKYQKKNNLSLKMAQNLGIKHNYQLCDMLIGPLQLEKIDRARIADRATIEEIYITINEKEGFLEYKVYDPFGVLQSDKIDLVNDLLYQKQAAPLTVDYLRNNQNYLAKIYEKMYQKGHISKINDEANRHAISAEMGGCCSIVMSEWPMSDPSKINLGAYDSGYVRVINEDPANGRSRLYYARQKRCCSILMSEIPKGISNVSLGEFDSGYVRIINEKNAINCLYYFNKDTKAWFSVGVDVTTLKNYDSKIHANDVPCRLSNAELMEIRTLTNHEHKRINTCESVNDVDDNKLDSYDALITERCRARITSKDPELAEQKKVCDLNEILIIRRGSTYEIGFCNIDGNYDHEPLSDVSAKHFLDTYPLEAYVENSEHHAKINELLSSYKSCSRVTNKIDAMRALSVKQLKSITLLTNHEHVEKQYLPSSLKRMSSAFFGGLMDGLYTYMGAIGLAALCPPLLVAMIVCCSLFTVACVINRCYEEYEFQQDFIRSRLNVELVILQKEIEDAFLKLQGIEHKSLENEADYHRQIDEILLNLAKHLIPKHQEKKKELELIAVLSNERALLSGLRSGLYAYSAICSVEFAIAAFYAIALTAFPPGFIIAGVILGLVCLVGFVLQALYAKNQHVEKVEEKEKKQCSARVVFSDPNDSIRQECTKSGDILFIRKDAGVEVLYRSKDGAFIQTKVNDTDVIDLVKCCITEGVVTQQADLKKVEALMRSLGISTHKKVTAYDDLMNLIAEYKKVRMSESSDPSKRVVVDDKQIDAIYKSMDFDPSAQKKAQEVLEWIRSFFSGLSKGQKAVDFPLNPLLEVDQAGHYHDTPWTVVLGLGASVCYAVVYALRAFAKNWRGVNDIPSPVRKNDPRLPRLDSYPEINPEPNLDSSDSMILLPSDEGRGGLDASPKSNIRPTLSVAAIGLNASEKSARHYSSPILTSTPVVKFNNANVASASSPHKSSSPLTFFGDWVKNMRRSSSTPAFENKQQGSVPAPSPAP